MLIKELHSEKEDSSEEVSTPGPLLYIQLIQLYLERILWGIIYTLSIIRSVLFFSKNVYQN